MRFATSCSDVSSIVDDASDVRGRFGGGVREGLRSQVLAIAFVFDRAFGLGLETSERPATGTANVPRCCGYCLLMGKEMDVVECFYLWRQLAFGNVLFVAGVRSCE